MLHRLSRLPLALLSALAVAAFSPESVGAAEPQAAQSEVETQTVYLSGRGADDAVEWDFFCSEGRKSGQWTKIRVPSCWEQEGFGAYSYGVRYYGKPNPPGIAREQGIYKTSFEAPASWRGRRIKLVFEAVMTDAKVRVNGVSAGPLHQGGFYRFSFDVTDLLRFGAKNDLEVTVDKESANESVNLAERRADYWNFGGIFRPVFLQVSPSANIDRVAIAADADGRFSADVFLGSASNTNQRVVGQILDGQGATVGESFSADVRASGDRVSLQTKLRAPKLWTAETPNLYRVRFSLLENGAERHLVTETFGFRTFEVRSGQGLFLNGQRVLLKGVNRHSFWPETGRTLSRERNYADVRLIKELNMNAVRMSHYPPDPEFLQACDELGLYVLDELGGWHGAYDTGVGRKLVQEMVTRDVNHPSILFWDNGNEGGWNVELDGEFAKWDPRNRPVLHPQKKLSGVETMHYRSYGETQEYLRGPDIYMPTEFLHGLYDGGHGAGLWDYWEMMRQHPRSGGGFLWVFADEGVARADENGRIDNAGSYAPDGLVGPHHEKEGSFNAVREIWSPVQIKLLDGAIGGPRVSIELENRYDFTPLENCRVDWELVRFPSPLERKSGHVTLAKGNVACPSAAPHRTARLAIDLPDAWREAEALYLTARDPNGAALWTWSFPVSSAHLQEGKFALPSSATKLATPSTSSASQPAAQETANQWIVTVGNTEYRFDKSNGYLAGVNVNGHAISLTRGPRFVAARRGDRTLDGTINPEAPKGVDRVYQEIADPEAKLTKLTVQAQGSEVVVEANYFGNLRLARWTLSSNGVAQLDYTYSYDGVVELMGVAFDYPESAARSIRWLGAGPYRVWQNRTQGGVLDVWENAYNDTIPGESFVYPEFKGYFRDWMWATLTTAEGEITVQNGSGGKFLGVFTPRDGRDAQLFTWPQTGLAFLDVIPAMRNKVNATDLIGPSSQPQRVQGERGGTVRLVFREP